MGQNSVFPREALCTSSVSKISKLLNPPMDNAFGSAKFATKVSGLNRGVNLCGAVVVKRQLSGSDLNCKLALPILQKHTGEQI